MWSNDCEVFHSFRAGCIRDFKGHLERDKSTQLKSGSLYRMILSESLPQPDSPEYGKLHSQIYAQPSQVAQCGKIRVNVDFLKT